MMEIRSLASAGGPAAAARAARSGGEALAHSAEEAARALVDDVRSRGGAALFEATRRFDRADLDAARLPDAAWDDLAAQCPAEVRAALERTAGRIEAFHRHQVPASFTVRHGGLLLEERVLPLERVGVYAPGGRAVYPSTVLMGAVPARVAGVREVLVATPPRPDGSVVPALALAARIAGAAGIFRMGGAQAVAALAYGAADVPRVDKIVGPGNAYVAAAKRLVAGEVGVDLDAGPTELLVIADRTADPRALACDLCAQAEHDPLAMVMLCADSAELAEAVRAAVTEELQALPSPAAEAALARGTIWVAAGAEALAFADALSPEHLALWIAGAEEALAAVPRCPAVFLGPHAPVPLGDYLAGANHTLPTRGAGRFQSALGAHDFVRRQHVIRADATALAADAPHIEALARAEGLPFHARAVEVRRG